MSKNIRFSFIRILYVLLIFSVNNAYCETDWDNYDWQAEEIVLDDEYFYQKQEDSSNMEININFIHIDTDSVVGDKTKAQKFHDQNIHYHPSPKGTQLSDRVLKAASPEKYYLKLASESIDAGHFLIGLQFLSSAYKHSSSLGRTRANSDKIINTLISNANKSTIEMDDYLILSQRLFDDTGRMNTPNVFSKEFRMTLDSLDGNLKKVHESEIYKGIKNRLAHLIKDGRLNRIMPVEENLIFALLDAQSSNVFFDSKMPRNLLWFISNNINNIIELEFNNNYLNRAEVTFFVFFEDNVYLGIVPKPDDFDKLLKKLSFQEGQFGILSLNQNEPQTAKHLCILSQKVYKIPLQSILKEPALNQLDLQN